MNQPPDLTLWIVTAAALALLGGACALTAAAGRRYDGWRARRAAARTHDHDQREAR